jgi:hypothetical protein
LRQRVAQRSRNAAILRWRRRRGAAVTFVRCSDCGISDCQILDPLHRGLELEDCVRCRVANNTIVDRRASPSMKHAIRVLGQSRDNLITGNILGGATEKLIDASGDRSEVRDNLPLRQGTSHGSR